MEQALKEAALARLRDGKPPDDIKTLADVTVGLEESICSFWQSCYLEDYIAAGGSKVKFLTGRPGSGKTHTLLLLVEAARRLGYFTVSFDARQVRLNQFNSVYQAVLDSADMDELVAAYCSGVVERLGYQPEQLPAGQDFLSWAVAQGRTPEMLKREIQEKLDTFYHDRKVNHNFAMAFIQLCADHLGARPLDPEQKVSLIEWLKGRAIPARDLRRLQIYTRIDKFNARHMLSSFLYLARQCGRKGICVTVDNLEALLERGPTGRALYGRAARNEVYESLRQLLDDFAGFTGAFFVFSCSTELVHDEKGGFKSYEALWMRIQNEVSGTRPNKFADLFNQDALVKELFTTDACLELQDKLNTLLATGLGLTKEDFVYLLETVSMESPIRRVITAIANQNQERGDAGGSIRGQADY